jgi:DNA-binding HxlR family transcriptional regulator
LFYIAVGFEVRIDAPRSGGPINLTLDALGDHRSLIGSRDLMFGNRHLFRELLTRWEEQIALNILADRLTRLEKAGLVSTELRTLMCQPF